MYRNHALLAAVLCALIIGVIYLIEFAGVLDTKVSGPHQAAGTITHCTGTENPDATIVWRRAPLEVYLDITGDKPLRFSKPKQAKRAVVELCERHAKVTVAFDTHKPQLRDDYRHYLIEMTDLRSGQPLFTRDSRAEWKHTNRRIAIGLMVFFGIGMLYSIFTMNRIIEGSTVADEAHKLRSGWWKGQFMIRSSERRPEAWVYLAWFGALAIGFGYHYFFKEQTHWLLLAAIGIFTAAAYAYLVEVVNINRVWIEDGALRFSSGPLPWFHVARRIAVDQIEGLQPKEHRHWSLHGPYVHTSVELVTVDGAAVHLFYTPNIEHAQAVARLTNAQLENLRRASWPSTNRR